MVTQEMLVYLGQILKSARLSKKLNQGEVADAMKIVQGQYSDIERAYIRPGQTRASVPDDDFLVSASDVLDIPILDLHAALGRIPPGSAAAALVREKAASREDFTLTPDQMDNLITEIEAIAVFRIQRMMEETEKQRQKQRRQQEQESQMDQRFVDEDKMVSRAGRN